MFKQVILSSILCLLLGFSESVSQKVGTAVISNIYKFSFPRKSFDVDFPGDNTIKRTLSSDSTTVYEDGAEQNHTLICPDAKLSIAVVLDRSISMAFIPNTTIPDNDSLRWRAAKNLIRGLANALQPPDNIALFSYARTTMLEQDFTNDGSLISSALAGIRLDSYTGTWIACDSALEALRYRSGYKAVILINDGDENVYWRFGGPNSEDVVEKAKTLGVPIYINGIGEFAGQTILESMATETGGKYYLNMDSTAVGKLYSELIDSSAIMPCKVSYNTTNFCADGTERQLRFEVTANGKDYAGEAVYIAPKVIQSVNVVANPIEIVQEGEEFWLSVRLEEIDRVDRAIQVHLELSFDSDVLEFIKIPTGVGVFWKKNPTVVVANGIIILDGEIPDPRGTYENRFSILFKAKDVYELTNVQFVWHALSLSTPCSIQVSSSDFLVTIMNECTDFLVPEVTIHLVDLFPNPISTGRLQGYIETSGEYPSTNTGSFYIRSMDGKVFESYKEQRFRVGAEFRFWDIEDLPSGVYWLELHSSNTIQRKAFTIIR